MLSSMRKLVTGRRFRNDEEGSILVFVMVVFSAMFLVGGVAVDLARHETLRSSLQYNLDRAVLAAASLRQTQDPETVVNDYMSKIKTIDTFTLTVNSSVALNSRSVTATANTDLDTWFLSMAGINNMPISAKSSASEKIPNLEIALVLDVSGSMANNSKLTNLQTAARDFVSTIINNSDPNAAVISIVPFSTSVTPSRNLYDALTVDELQSNSTCLYFENDDYSDLGIDPSVSQEQIIYTSLYGEQITGGDPFNHGWQSCFIQSQNEITAYSNSITDLHAAINALSADGSTSGHQGVKWGTAILDPKFQPVVDSLILDGDVNNAFDALPVNYAESNTRKVMVFMGDGANFNQRMFDSNWRGTGSDLLKVTNEEPGAFTHLIYNGWSYVGAGYEVYCVYSWVTCHYSDPVTEVRYFLDKAGSTGYHDITNNVARSQSWFTDTYLAGLTGTVAQEHLTWEQAWGVVSPQYYSDNIGNQSARNNWLSGPKVRYTTELNTLMHAQCDQARDAGIIIYSIGFETNDTTDEALKACASTDSHFFEATGTEISTVFGSIAANIQKLKLTQ